MSQIPRPALACIALLLGCGRDAEQAPAPSLAAPTVEVEPEPVEQPTPSEPAPEPPAAAADAFVGSGYARGSGAGFGGRGKRVAQVRHAKAQVDGALDRDIVRKHVRKHINDVRACYNLGLTPSPNLQGRVAIEFVIAPSGKVSESKVQATTMKDPGPSECIAEAVRGWRFPRPEDGEPVTVIYPFNLSPG